MKIKKDEIRSLNHLTALQNIYVRVYEINDKLFDLYWENNDRPFMSVEQIEKLKEAHKLVDEVTNEIFTEAQKIASKCFSK